MSHTMAEREHLDLFQLTPDELRAAPQNLFMRVVDADLKREHRKYGQPVPAWVTEALRTEHLDRWQASLEQMLVQVEGRLAVLEADWAARSQRLHGDELACGLDDYHSACLRAQRFRAGVQNALAEADGLYDGRLTELENAIRAHRREVEADDSVEPSVSDWRLWNTLNNDS